MTRCTWSSQSVVWLVSLTLTSVWSATLPPQPPTTQPQPQVPEELLCRSYNWEEMTCTWGTEPGSTVSWETLRGDAPTTPTIPTTRDGKVVTTQAVSTMPPPPPATTLYWTLQHPKFGTYRCPHPVGDTGCRWHHLDGADSFRPGMRYLMRLQTRTDSGRLIWSQVFKIKTKLIVEPAGVVNTTIEMLGRPEDGLVAPRLTPYVDEDEAIPGEEKEEEVLGVDQKQENSSDSVDEKDGKLKASKHLNESFLKLLEINSGEIRYPEARQTAEQEHDRNGDETGEDEEQQDKDLDEIHTKKNKAHKKRHDHSRKRRRHREVDEEEKSRRRPRRSAGEFKPVDVPAVAEEHKEKYLLKWQPPKQLDILPLQYRVNYWPHTNKNNRKTKKDKSKKKEQEPPHVTEQTELVLEHLSLDTNTDYIVSIEAKPQRRGFWSRPDLYLLTP